VKVDYFYAYESNTGDYFYGYVYDDQGKYVSGSTVTSPTDEDGGTWTYVVYSTQSSSVSAAYNGYVYDTAYYDHDQGNAGYATYSGANGYRSGTNFLGSDYDYLYDNGGYQLFGGGYWVVPEAAVMKVDYFYAYESKTGDYFYGYVYDDQGKYSSGSTATSPTDEDGGTWTYVVYSTQSSSVSAAYNGYVYDTAYYDHDQGNAVYATYFGANGYRSGTNFLGSDYDYVYDNGGYQLFGGGYWVVGGASGKAGAGATASAASSQGYAPYAAAQLSDIHSFVGSSAATNTAIYDGTHTDYSFAQLPGGWFQVSDLRTGAPDGVDQYQNNWSFEFSDGTYTLTPIQTDGSTTLAEFATQYFLDGSGGYGPELSLAGTDVVAGQFGAWTPIGAVQTASGYLVAWEVPGANEYTIWNTDSNGNFVSDTIGVVSKTTLESLDPIFDQNLIGDGVIGPPGKSSGTVAGQATTIAAGAAVEIPSAYSGAVTFAGSTGTLQLDNSASFSGTVAGMADQDTLDLRDINPATVQTPTYSGTSSGGTLTVTDGTHSANIALLGNYLASTFVASSDGHGGTAIVDPLLIASSQQTLLTQPHHT
jgi:hypothetical protein